MPERPGRPDLDERFSLYPMEGEEALEKLLQGTETDPGAAPGTGTSLRDGDGGEDRLEGDDS